MKNNRFFTLKFYHENCDFPNHTCFTCLFKPLFQPYLQLGTSSVTLINCYLHCSLFVSKIVAGRRGEYKPKMHCTLVTDYGLDLRLQLGLGLALVLWMRLPITQDTDHSVDCGVPTFNLNA